MSSSESEKTLDVLLDNIRTKNDWNPEAVLQQALKELNRLLLEHPELLKLQDELDHRLESVDNFEDRMEIIGRMIGDCLNRLSDECKELESMLLGIGIDKKLPITQFKESFNFPTIFLKDSKDKKP